MGERIINFITILRQSNIRISISESIDACNALKICDIFDKDQFKTVLKSTLIKDQSNLEIFDKIFDLYFSEPLDKEKQEEMTEEDFNNMLKNLKDSFDNSQFDQLGDPKGDSFNQPFEQDYSYNNNYDKDKQLKDMYTQGSESDMMEMAQQLANSTNFEFCNEFDININDMVNNILIKNNFEYTKSRIKSETRKSRQSEIDEKHNQFKKMLKEQIEKQLIKQLGQNMINEIIDNDNILDKDLASLSTDELEKIQQIIKKLAKKFSSHSSRKYKKAKNGNIDIRKTIKSSIKTGNVCSELRFKTKKKDKMELVVLCDISGSVWMYVDFMLQLVMAMQNVFDRVESYVFVDKILKITEDLNNKDVDIKNILDYILCSGKLGYGTDYANSFKEFSNEGQLFNKKTVLIILGDAENTNNNENGEDYLRIVSDQCKNVFWLNPKEKDRWYGGLSELYTYEKHCDGVYQSTTLRQIEEFVKNCIKL